MKLVIFSILLTTIIITITSCTNTTTKDTHEKTYTIDTSLLTPADIAKADIAYFDTLCMKYLTFPPVNGHSIPASQVPIKAFTIRAEDLFAALGVSDSVQHIYNNIRVYFAYNQSQNQFKLYIVPVLSADIADTIPGRDVLLDHSGNPIPRPNTPPLADRYVLDLNAPCPSLCDVSTPLMKATSHK